MSPSDTWQPSDIQKSVPEADGDQPKRRGRIPQSAWPRIVEMHRAGATLSAIAREFDCTPSAISYILKKAETAGPESDATQAPSAADEPATPVNTAPTSAEAATTPPARPAAVAPAQNTPAQNTAAQNTATPNPPAPQSRITGQIGLRSVSASSSTAPAPAQAPAAVATPPAAQPAGAAAAASSGQPAAGEAAPRPGASAAGRTEPAPVDAVEGRLRETARATLAAYRTWRQHSGEQSIQQLNDAIHELRKALARIEIDISATRRDEQAARPIPIPWHRAARRSTPTGTAG